MSPTTRLGNVTLPNPDKDGISSEDVPCGDAYRSARGRLQLDVMGVARRWTLRWSLLTQAERELVRGAWRMALFSATCSWLELPDGSQFQVWPRLGAWQEAQIYDTNDVPRCNLTASFDEAYYSSEGPA